MTTRSQQHHKPKVSNAEACKLRDSEARLYCEERKKLEEILRLPCNVGWISEWLFGSPKRSFHKHLSLPAHAINSSIAVRAWHRAPRPGTSRQFVPAPGASFKSGSVHPGYDTLFIPVGCRGNVLLGYTLGGRNANDGQVPGCAYDSHYCPFFPHFVGRFVFDVGNKELLNYVNGMTEELAGLMSVREAGGVKRERCLFVVPNVEYKEGKMPEKIYSMVTSRERRLESQTKFQWIGNDAVMGEGEKSETVVEDEGVLRGYIGRLERLLKGEFFAEKIQKDVLDVENNEVTSRITGQILVSFGQMDGNMVQVFREIGERIYAKEGERN